MNKLNALVTAIALTLAFSGCSSKSKKVEAAHDSAPAAKTAAIETAKSAETKKVEAKKESKKSAKAAATTEAKSESSEVSQKLTCTQGSDTRTLESKADGKGCVVIYTKAGAEKQIANAQNDVSFCQSVIERVSKKLQDSGMTCK